MVTLPLAWNERGTSHHHRAAIPSKIETKWRRPLTCAFFSPRRLLSWPQAGKPAETTSTVVEQNIPPAFVAVPATFFKKTDVAQPGKDFGNERLNTPGMRLSQPEMKRAKCVIPWKEGLHLVPASRLVRLALASKSAIWLKVGDKVADARSILAVLLLHAVAGMVIELEIAGEDEDATMTSFASVFAPALSS